MSPDDIVNCYIYYHCHTYYFKQFVHHYAFTILFTNCNHFSLNPFKQPYLFITIDKHSIQNTFKFYIYPKKSCEMLLQAEQITMLFFRTLLCFIEQ